MSNQQGISAGGHFDADRPIERREQDRLDRRSFAESIARQVRSVPAEHGFTIAVAGEWGSGKTSVLNMVAEALEGDDDVAILHFNPWLFSSADDLVTRFFRELSAQLGRGRSEKLKNVAKAVGELGQSLAPLSPVPGTTSVANLLGKITNQWAKQPSLHEKRDRLRKALEQAKSRIVVVVDDIDRLEAGETREVMRLVRLTSDLPHVVFLLAFDRGHVARSLGETEADGRRYLEKIVQVSYDLPTVREAILPGMFLPLLEELMEGRDLAEMDRGTWSRVFYDVIKPLLGNLRDVKRYLYSIPVTLDSTGQEVALADLLGLEAIRILRPSLFSDLRAHVHCLVHTEAGPASWRNEEIRNRETAKELSSMLERAGDDSEILNSAFEVLFPVTQGFLGRGYHGSAQVGRWRMHRRIACEEVLRIYLQAGLDEGMIPSRELKDLVEALTDEQKLMRLIDTLDEQQFEAALERLEDYEQEFPVDAAPVAVPVILDRMGRLSTNWSGMLGFSPRFKATRVVLRLLTRIEDPTDLSNCVSEMIKRVDSLSGQFELVEMVGHRESVGHKLISEEQVRKLEDQLVDLLKSAPTEKLIGEWNLFALSLRPLNWLEGEERSRLASRLREHLVDDGFVLTLLRTAVSYVHYNGHSDKRFSWDHMIKVFGEGIADAVDRLAHSPLWSDLSEDDKNIISLAQRYSSGLGSGA